MAAEKSFLAKRGSKVRFCKNVGSHKRFPRNIRKEIKVINIPKGMLRPGSGMGSKKGRARIRVIRALS
jgi:hypothetical protein